MALIGISLLVASVVIFCLRPPAWLPNLLGTLRQRRISGRPPRPAVAPPEPEGDERAGRAELEMPEQLVPLIQEPDGHKEAGEGSGVPTQPAPVIQEPQAETSGASWQHVRTEEVSDEEQTTPKVSATTRNDAVPSLVLPEAPVVKPSERTPEVTTPSVTVAAPPPLQLDVVPEPPRTASELMPPPPVPKAKKKPRPCGIPQPTSSTSPRRIPTLNRTTSPIPNRNLPTPRRGAPAPPNTTSSSGLAPPPTATSIPKKPSRQVTLEPGHSPLDWARLAQGPTSDLRGLPPNTPYLRVTPSMLRQQNGRKGRDAWSVFGGKVYNISPYIPFHPGGGPELLRGAGKDGTRLFAEVHPWVNYDTMLQSCLIGLLVEEHEGPNQMEEMD